MWMMLFNFSPRIYAYLQKEYGAYKNDPPKYRNDVETKFHDRVERTSDLVSLTKEKVTGNVVAKDLVLETLSLEQKLEFEKVVGARRYGELLKNSRTVTNGGMEFEALPLEKLPPEIREQVEAIRNGSQHGGTAAKFDSATSGGSKSLNSAADINGTNSTKSLADQAARNNSVNGGSTPQNPTNEANMGNSVTNKELGLRSGLINRADGTVNIGQKFSFDAVDASLKSSKLTSWTTNQGLANSAAGLGGSALKLTGMFNAVKYGVASLFTDDAEKKEAYGDIAKGNAKNVGIMAGFGMAATKAVPWIAGAVKGVTLFGKAIPGVAVVAGALSLVTETGFATYDAITGRSGWGKVGNALVGNTLGTVGGLLGPLGMGLQQGYVELSKNWSSPENVGWDTLPVAGFKAVTNLNVTSLDVGQPVQHGVDMRLLKDTKVELRDFKANVVTPPPSTPIGKAFNVAVRV